MDLQERLPAASLMNGRWWLLVLTLATTIAVADGLQHLPRQSACLQTPDGTIPIQVEVAMTSSERQAGLMERTVLPPVAGMLFLYPEPQAATRGFWMYRTRLPLDIAYLDATGEIVSIQRMTPCPPDQGRDCPKYPSGQPFSAVLEMNAGFFQANDVTVGDRLIHPLSGFQTGVDDSPQPGTPPDC